MQKSKVTEVCQRLPPSGEGFEGFNMERQLRVHLSVLPSTIFCVGLLSYITGELYEGSLAGIWLDEVPYQVFT